MLPQIAWPPFEQVWAVCEPELKGAEGLRLSPYLCPTGIWTISWGVTHYPDGRAVSPTDPAITIAEAQVYLEAAAKQKYAQLRLSGAVTRAPTIHQSAGFLSLVYNIGVGVHDGKKGDFADSTLLEKFNAGDDQGAADRFGDWIYGHVDGKAVVIKGLPGRRQSERAMFLTPDAPPAQPPVPTA